MALMPVSKTSDLVERRTSGGGCLVHRAPLHTFQRRLAVDGVAEDVEHARQDRLADRRLQRPAGVLHRHAARQPLGRCQRDAAHVSCVALGQNFNGHLPAIPCVQQGVDGRQCAVKSHVHDAAANRHDNASR